MKLKLNLNNKKTINIIIMALLVAVVIVCVGRNIKLNSINADLNSYIEEQEEMLCKLSDDNAVLSNDVVQLNDDNGRLQEANSVLEARVEEALSRIEELEEELEIKKKTEASTRRDFKSYMSYKAITNHYSDQWKLQLKATTNEDGIRCIDGIPLVAVGTGWGLWVGDRAIVTCENGNSFEVIVGDIKSDRHTDEERKTTVANGCRCEFIVDVPAMNATARIMGNLAVMSKYSGYVINIEKVN